MLLLAKFVLVGCGMRMDHIVQVDTHAWQFMQRSGYLPQLKKASGLTDSNYALIGETLRNRYGAHTAGWAFIVLFVAEVRFSI